MAFCLYLLLLYYSSYHYIVFLWLVSCNEYLYAYKISIFIQNAVLHSHADVLLPLKMIKMILSLQITKTSFLNMEFKDLEVLGVKYYSDRKCLIG